MSKFPTYYMDEAVFHLPEVLATAEDRLKDVDFDTIVGTGFSGGIVVPSLALAMGKKFVLVRKESDDSHHGKGRLLGELGSRWIFVDDFIATGKTRQRVFDKIDAAREIDSKYVGQYMYISYRDGGPAFSYAHEHLC